MDALSRSIALAHVPTRIERRPLDASGRAYVIALALSCSLMPAPFAQSPSPARFLLDSISAPELTKLQMRCRDTGIQELYSSGIITGCMGRIADTLFIAYKTRGGEMLAMTKQFFVERPRLAMVGDSVRAALSIQFGPARHCPQTFWTGARWDSWQWQIGPLTIQLATNAQQAPLKSGQRDLPWVGVQFAEAKLACGDWLPLAVPID